MSRWITYNVGDAGPSFRSAPGCYVVYLDGKVAYVGQTADISRRFLTGHRFRLSRYSSWINTPWGRHVGVTIKVSYSVKYGDWAMRELRLIRRLQPPQNCLGVK